MQLHSSRLRTMARKIFSQVSYSYLDWNEVRLTKDALEFADGYLKSSQCLRHPAQISTSHHPSFFVLQLHSVQLMETPKPALLVYYDIKLFTAACHLDTRHGADTRFRLKTDAPN